MTDKVIIIIFAAINLILWFLVIGMFSVIHKTLETLNKEIKNFSSKTEKGIDYQHQTFLLTNDMASIVVEACAKMTGAKIEAEARK